MHKMDKRYTTSYLQREKISKRKKIFHFSHKVVLKKLI